MKTSRTITVAVAVSLLAGAALSACGSDGKAPSTPSVTQVGSGDGDTTTTGGDAPNGATPEVDTVVAASVHEPIALITRPDDDEHLWLAEREGRVRMLTIADEGNMLSPAGDYLLDISEDTSTESERGLLGMAFSPDGDTLYLSYTNLEGNSRVVSYAMDGMMVDESTREVVFSADQPFPNHNGGHILFGPDGKLWLGLGDGGAGDDPENRAQDPASPLGKIHRLDPATGEDEIVVSGLRNPWRFSFDRDGSLWIGDVGQNAFEEIDHLPADQIDGANLGWSGYEGREPYLDGDGRRPADAIGPVFDYSREGGNCSITGGFAYHGRAIAGLEGAYLFADYCAGRLRAITLDDDGKLAKELDLGIDLESPISFAQDQDGEPYVLLQGGNIVRLIPGS